MVENPKAFPNTGNPTWGMGPEYGMTLRDYFAGQALVGLLSGQNAESGPLEPYRRSARGSRNRRRDACRPLSHRWRPLMADLLQAAERMMAARQALEHAPTHSNAAFDAAFAEHEASLAGLAAAIAAARTHTPHIEGAKHG